MYFFAFLPPSAWVQEAKANSLLLGCKRPTAESSTTDREINPHQPRFFQGRIDAMLQEFE